MHSTVTTSRGGPHVGTDHSSRVNKISEPVPLDPQGRARLVCELKDCRGAYDLRVFPAKKRSQIFLRRMLFLILALVAGSLMAQLGTSVYDAGDHSQALRITGDLLTGGGVVANLILILGSLFTLWFWPPRYKLEPAPAEDTQSGTPRTTGRYSDVRAAHSVRLLP